MSDTLKTGALNRRTTGDPKHQTGDVTRLLAAWTNGEGGAERELLPLVYRELRQIAGGYLASERVDHTLQPTALVHEAYLRLIRHQRIEWKDRSQFFAFAAKVIRHILIDYARSKRCAKRGGGTIAVPLVEIGDLTAERPAALVALDEALDALARLDPLKASIVEYRFFAGLSAREIAEILGCSAASVNRHWWMAKAWLFRELTGGESHAE